MHNKKSDAYNNASYGVVPKGCPCKDCKSRHHACSLDCEGWKRWKHKQEKLRSIVNNKRTEKDEE